MTLLVDDPTVRYTRVLYELLFGGYDDARPAHRWARRQWEAVVGKWVAFKGRGPGEGGWLWWLLCAGDEHEEGRHQGGDAGGAVMEGKEIELPIDYDGRK